MSVEAALLVPVVLALVALLAQPACVLYARAVKASDRNNFGSFVIKT